MPSTSLAAAAALAAASLSLLAGESVAFVLTPPTCPRSHQHGDVSIARSMSYLDDISSSGPMSQSILHFSAAAPVTTSSPAHAHQSPTSSSGGFAHVPVLGLEHADAIANNVVNICTRNGFNPVTVTVLDASGSTLVSKRMDGCSPVGIPDISHAKAYSCIVNKYPSRAFRDRYTSEPQQSAKFCQMTTMVAISGNQMAPFPGGIVLKLGDYVIGAVGVSGAAGDEDEYCAIQAVKEANLGLETVPEAHSCSTVRD